MMSLSPNLPPDKQREMLRQMLMIRRFEERASADYLAGKIYGVVHCYIGHLLGDGFERGLVICQLSHRRLLASGRKHIVGRLLGQRERAGLGEGDSGFEHAHNVGFHAPQSRIV